MRGKPLKRVPALRRKGITPADAGKTKKLQFAADGMEDHPRGCGENQNGHKRRYELPGSPPRMRGKQRQVYEAFADYRITPADAGKTF